MDSLALSAAANLADLEKSARGRLDQAYFDYYAGGANDEITLNENVTAWSRIRLRPRVLVDVSRLDRAVEILGRHFSAPVIIAPMAFQRLAHPDGELATARAAAAHGAGMILSTFSTSAISEVRAATDSPLWFQLYVYKDREVTRALVERATLDGCEALVFTVDAPLIGRRERDVRNKLQLPRDLRVVNAASLSEGRAVPGMTDSVLAHHITEMIDPALTWRDIEWIRSITRLPVIVKGIQRADDAARAALAGVDGVVISNHGGRQLDTARATALIVREVADAVAGRMVVLVDGGIRRGTDIIKAIALGADAVLIGRPILWGLVSGGEDGVDRVLELIRNELELAMALCGCTSIASIKRDLVEEAGCQPC
jgi:4-hydroxymandelate oxidase